MNILFYIGHPAQYHFFKNAARKLVQDGHHIKLLIKTKDILEELLKEDGWEYENIQVKSRGNGKLSIFAASLKRTIRVIGIARRFRADLLAGTDSSVAQAGWFLHRPCITTLEDDYEIICNLARLTYPFTTTILVPDVCKVGKWEKKKVGYDGYMKLAYLHPSRFSPSEEVLEKYGISGKFILLRLAKLTAHHDVGIKGLDVALVGKIIEISKKKGYKIFITSEKELDSQFEQYRLNIRFVDIHHILSFASLLVSDSQSMSMEAAMLGVPSLRFSDFAGRISVLEELESRYHLTYGIKTSEPHLLIDMIEKLLSNDMLKDVFQARRRSMLADKIDVTAFLVWFIEKYPDSLRDLNENNAVQDMFKILR